MLYQELILKLIVREGFEVRCREKLEKILEYYLSNY